MQIILKLLPWIHAHMRTVGAGKLPRTMVGKAQNLIAAANGALDIFLVPTGRMAAAGCMGMKIGLHGKIFVLHSMGNCLAQNNHIDTLFLPSQIGSG